MRDSLYRMAQRKIAKTSKKHDSFSVEHITVVLFSHHFLIGFFHLQERQRVIVVFKDVS